jgi:cytoskeletal protein RodZ
MEPLGVRLRQAREARKLSLREIAAATKISVSTLEALERGDMSRLPGGIFGRAFVRAYALQVGLDPEAAIEDLVEELDQREREAVRSRKKPGISADDLAFLARQRRAVRLLRIGLGVAGLVVAVIVAWQMWPGREAAGGGETVPAAEVRLPPTPPPAPPPASADLPVVPPASELVVDVEVSADCWMEVTADGLVILSRLLKAGERQRWTADRELWLDVGDAGVVTWSINGSPANPIGARGVHRRVLVTPETIAAYLR